VIAVLGTLLVLPGRARNEGLRLDIPGAALVCGGMTALVYGLAEVASRGWNSPIVLVALGAAAVLLLAFVILQAHVSSPLLPLRVLTERNRAGSFIARALLGIGQFALFFFLTYQFQVVMGFSPLVAGAALLPLLAANAVGSILIAPRLVPHVQPRLLIVPGILLCVAALLLLTRLTPTTSYAPLILAAELLLGLGGGVTITPATNTALSSVDPKDAGVTSGMASASQQTGASIGTALLNSIAASAATAFLASHAGVADPNAVIVHGYTVAAAWGAAILLVGAIFVAALINADAKSGPRTRS
jgi:predicted MFS family arabinose efflux permease